MVADMHTCSYACDNPPCIKRQRDELLARIDALTADAERYAAMRDWFLRSGKRMEIAPLGHINVTTAEEVDAWADAARHKEPASGR